MIYLVNKKTKRENIEKKYPNAYIMDLTSKARDPYVRFSPFYPHGNIPVPYSDNLYSQTVEGIWQALKVFESEGIDLSKLEIKNMEGIKRTIRTKGPIVGHQKGVNSKDILGYLEARLNIYLPSYKYTLDNYLQEFVEKMRLAHEQKDLVFLDYDTNSIIESTKPLSHAFLVKCYVEGKYPTCSNYKELDLKNIETIKKKSIKRLKSKVATNNKPEQTSLF